MNKEKLLDALLDFVRELEGYEVFDNLREYLFDCEDVDEQLTAALDHIKRYREEAATILPCFKFVPELDGIITLVEAALV